MLYIILEHQKLILKWAFDEFQWQEIEGFWNPPEFQNILLDQTGQIRLIILITIPNTQIRTKLTKPNIKITYFS